LPRLSDSQRPLEELSHAAILPGAANSGAKVIREAFAERDRLIEQINRKDV
jgi:hypothetical protein